MFVLRTIFNYNIGIKIFSIYTLNVTKTFFIVDYSTYIINYRTLLFQYLVILINLKTIINFQYFVLNNTYLIITRIIFIYKFR